MWDVHFSLEVGHGSWVDHKVCKTCVIFKLNGEVAINLCFTHLCLFIDPL